MHKHSWSELPYSRGEDGTVGGSSDGEAVNGGCESGERDEKSRAVHFWLGGKEGGLMEVCGVLCERLESWSL